MSKKVEEYDSQYNVYRILYYNDEEQIHRDDGPAIIWQDGSYEYFINGQRHRIDGPALYYSQGRIAKCEMHYYQVDHKDIQPYSIEYKPGDVAWFYDGLLHREGGPALERGSIKLYMSHGIAHRPDGPAVINDFRKEYWLDGEKLKFEKFWEIQKDTEYANTIMAQALGETNG